MDVHFLLENLERCITKILSQLPVKYGAGGAQACAGVEQQG